MSDAQVPAVARATAGHQRDARRTPNPAWVEALGALAPRSEVHSWLHLAWEPGDPWAPVDRWVVWQMIPPAGIDPRMRVDLEGPDPRSRGHYCAPNQCACKAHSHAWRGGASALIDRAQWRMFRGLDDPATAGHLCVRWWIVQGTGGGHQRRFTAVESRLLRLHGLPAEPALPGDLCYAEPDARTWAAIRQRDTMAQGRVFTESLERVAQWFDAEETKALEAGRAQLLAWLGEQVKDTLESGAGSLQRVLAEQRDPNAARPRVDYDRAGDEFVRGVPLDLDEPEMRATRTSTLVIPPHAP